MWHVARNLHPQRFLVSSEHRVDRLRMPVLAGKEDRLRRCAGTSPRTRHNPLLHRVSAPLWLSTARDRAILRGVLLTVREPPRHLLPQMLPLAKCESLIPHEPQAHLLRLRQPAAYNGATDHKR